VYEDLPTCETEICGLYVTDKILIQKTAHFSKAGEGGGWQSSVIAIMTSVLMIRDSNPGRRKIFLTFLNRSGLLWSPPSLLFSRNSCSYLRLKQQNHGFDRSSLYRAEGKN